MTLERRLQINLAILTSLGTLLLAVAEGEPRLAVLAVAVAATSLVFTDGKRWLVLNSLWSNVAGVAALALTMLHWQSIERELLFIALANFLTYLQCILHYRQKQLHVYGMLILLSFLQTAVAAVMASTFVFGCLLLAYLWAAVRTLSLYVMFREWHEHGTMDRRHFKDTMSLAEFLVTPLHQLIGKLWALRRPATPPTPPPAYRWRLAGERGGFHTANRAHEAHPLRGLNWHVAKFGLLTLLLAPLAFVAAPRTGQQQLPMQGTGGVSALMGFSERVMLHDVTRIQENPDQVLRFRLNHFDRGQIGEAYELREPPWLRGVALGRYTFGAWKPEEWEGKPELASWDAPALRDRLLHAGDNDLVLFEATVEPIHASSAVFSLPPAYRVPGPEPSYLRTEGSTHEFYRPRDKRRSSFTYRLLTTGLKEGSQVPLTPQTEPYAWQQKTELLEPFAAGLYVPEHQLPYKRNARRDIRWQGLSRQRQRLQGLADAAANVLQEAKLDPRGNPREAALALEQFLQTKGGFVYTLNRTPLPGAEADSDPVNDFVVRDRRGHCEYFASALALMLRSQGIPSRLIVGYKGGEWNAVGGYYEVRQLDAHAWVEAWLFAGGQPQGWLRLDPTPGGEVAAAVPTTAAWKQVFNYADYLWSRYVMGMDASVRDETLQSFKALLQGDNGRSLGRQLGDFLRGAEANLLGIGVRIVLLALAVMGLWRVLPRVMRRLAARIRGDRVPASSLRVQTPVVDFYLRLERLLARCGLSRAASQTPREYALAAADGALAARFSSEAETPRLAAIVEAYYRVRFGGEPLSDTERSAVEEELARLEALLAAATSAAGRRGKKHV